MASLGGHIFGHLADATMDSQGGHIFSAGLGGRTLGRLAGATYCNSWTRVLAAGSLQPLTALRVAHFRRLGVLHGPGISPVVRAGAGQAQAPGGTAALPAYYYTPGPFREGMNCVALQWYVVCCDIMVCTHTRPFTESHRVCC